MEEDSLKHEDNFLKLFLKHENALRAYARSLLPSWDCVDEVLQEASLVMWEKLDQLKEEDGFLPWGKVIVRFKSLNYIQKVHTQKKVFSTSTLELISEMAMKTTQDDLDDHKVALGKCLSKFKAIDRDLIFAPYMRDGQLQAIAEREKKTINALYKKLGRLRKILETCIKSDLQGAVS